MSEPTFVPLNTGNPHDDDGRIIDDLFLEVDAPPALVPTVTVTPETDRPKVVNRLLIGTMILPIGGNATPWPILPMDARRKNVQVELHSTVATDFIRVGDDGNKLTTVGGSFLVYHGFPFNPWDLTSALFIHGPDLTGVGTVTWWAVTE